MDKTRKNTVSSPLKNGGAKKKRKVEHQGDGAEGSSLQKQQKRTKGKTKEATEKGQFEYQFDEDDSFRGRININSRQLFIREIENRLSPTDWRIIEEGPFGKVIKILKQVSFSSQIVHAVMFKQLKTNKKKETWYGVGGKEIRFSIKEFSLITGLNCGVPPVVNTKGDKLVMKNFFGGPGSHKILVHDLWERFKDYRENDNYKFKLAMLLIVEGLIMGGDKKRLVKVEHVKLLENMDLFYSYPWGRIGYEDLHRSLTKSLSARMETIEIAKAMSKSKTPRLPYSMQGMPVVFQIWIYEAIKPMGLAFAKRLNEYANPRGLRWFSEKTPEHGVVDLALEDANMDVKHILQPEDDEEEMLLSNCLYSDEDNDEYFDAIVKKFECEKKKLKRKQISGTQKKDSSDPVMCAITELAQGIKKIEKLLTERIQRLEERVESLAFSNKHKDEETTYKNVDDDNEPLDHHKYDDDERDSVEMNQKTYVSDDEIEANQEDALEIEKNHSLAINKVAIGNVFLGGEEKLNQDAEVDGKADEEVAKGEMIDVEKENPSNDIEEDREDEEEVANGKTEDNSELDKREGKIKNISKKLVVLPKRVLPQRNKQKSKHTSSPYTNQVAKPAKTIVKEKTKKKVTNRIKAAGNPDKMVELFNWLESDSDGEHKGPTGTMLDKTFFWLLIEPQTWIKSEQLEQVLCLLREKVVTKPDVYQDVVILDMYWVNYVSRMWETHTKGHSTKRIADKLLKYCFGSIPEVHGKSWENSEVVYVPFNIKGKHWIALQIDLRDWKIYMYDSDVNLYSSSVVEKLLTPVTHGLPLILKQYSPLAKLLETRGDQHFSVSRSTRMKSNKQGGDCGIYTLKYIELLSAGAIDLSAVEDKYIDQYRSFLALSVWNCKWDSP